MISMIEKVAEAIIKNINYHDPQNSDFNKAAKEAIEAMKEPTEEMIDYCALYASVGNNSAKEVIEAYINAALDNK